MRAIDDEWQAAMRQSDFSRAWQISDRHLRKGQSVKPVQHLPRHLQSIWDGRALTDKRVLVRCYHGLGDTIQFIRFAKPLRALAREVTVWCQPKIIPIVATADGIDRIIPLHDGTPDVEYDADIEIMELAHALRITATNMPGAIPYLHRGPTTPLRPHEPVRVGLVWAAGTWDPRRSLPLAALAPVLHLPQFDFRALQRGPARAQLTGLPVADHSTDEVNALADLLLSLDLLISVDTFVAHLAGALGVRVWLLLHTDCDWRWSRDSTHSVWYPTMQLYHQATPGDWLSVAHAVAADLQMLSRLPAHQQITGTNTSR
jgi:hypothetical protein